MDDRSRTAAIFGGGIAGLTAAHELARRGWTVTIHETNDQVGGFFRSTRAAANTPSEYSWHGMGPWYNNVFDLMKQIPSGRGGTVYTDALSRPIDFGMVPDDGAAAFDDTHVVNVRNMFRMTSVDLARWTWLTLKTWTSRRRSLESYARLNAAEEYGRVLSPGAWRMWRACFGPWVGSDWTNVSLHQVGLFFRKQLFTRPVHQHPADDQGPAWTHGPRSGWLVLRGPSSEVWFDPWVADLERRRVRVRYRAALAGFEVEGGRVARARLATGEAVEAELYVLATDPFTAHDVIDRTPGLDDREELRCLGPLVRDGPHTQVSFRLAFGEPIAWPRDRTAVVIADSEFNLTLFAEEQAWHPDVELGEGVAALWTGTACVAKRPGRLFGLPLERCTKEQFLAEVVAQLGRCRGLDALVREANGGRSWTSFPIVRIEVWHEWMFSPDGIRPRQPKWVNTTRTQQYMPDQRTSVPNLVLAGAHTRTFADVWSIEAAVESGRRAARVVEPDVPVIPEHVPAPLRLARRVDDLCYGLGLPHLLDLLAVGLPALVVTALAARALHRARLDAELADLLGEALGRRLRLPPCSASSPVARWPGSADGRRGAGRRASPQPLRPRR